jgi:hypothetical protein
LKVDSPVSELTAADKAALVEARRRVRLNERQGE